MILRNSISTPHNIPTSIGKINPQPQRHLRKTCSMLTSPRRRAFEVRSQNSAVRSYDMLGLGSSLAVAVAMIRARSGTRARSGAVIVSSSPLSRRYIDQFTLRMSCQFDARTVESRVA